MTHGIPSVVDAAFFRIASSDEPERFRWLVTDLAVRLDAGGLLDLSTAAWDHKDKLLLAAEIEAMAGVRRVAALSHSHSRCRCLACRVRTRLRKSRKDKA